MKTFLTTAALAAALIVGPSAALADPPPWAHGGGEGKGNPHGEPPGLAKKPYGLPPGQAKKLWGKGERLPIAYVEAPQYVVVHPARYELPPAPYGCRWVRVEDRYYLAQTRTGLILQVIDALLR